MKSTLTRLSRILPLMCVAALAQDTGSASSSSFVPAIIMVRLQLEGRPLNMQYVRVQLIGSNGSFLSEVATNERGEANLRATAPGNYEIRILSPELEESPPEMISLFPRETRRFVFKDVRLKSAVGGSAPGSPAALVGLGEFNIPADARQAFEEGDSALARQDFPEARKRFERAVRIHPKYAAAHNNLGVALMQLGEVEQGRKAFEKAIKLDARLSGAYVNLGKIALGEQKYAEAESLLLRSLTADPNNPETLALAAFAQLGLGKLDEAIANARKVHAVPHPRSAMAHFVAARALEAQQRPAEAVAEYKTFLAESPQSPNAARAQQALASLEGRKP